jgi:hypothetical protein
MDFKEDYQQKDEVVSVNQNQEQQTQQDGYAEDQSEQGLEEAAWAAKIQGGAQESATSETKEKTHHEGKERKDRNKQPKKNLAARLKGDNDLKSIFDGTKTIKEGDKGLDVVKLQQVLVDMKYQLPVTGKFKKDTVTILKKFQTDAKINVSGELDKETIQAMDARFNKRTDYITAADDFDEKDPKKDTRKLSRKDKKAALKTLKPQPAVAGASFDKKDAKAYSDEIKKSLDTIIPRFHKELHTDVAPLRADPKKNFHKDNDLEGAANVGKEVTDELYGDLNKGPVFKMDVNLIDQWKDEEDNQKLLSDSDKEDKARALVKYFIDANCNDINSKYNASPSEKKETKALKAVINSFVDSKAKIQTLLDIDTGWEGAQSGGMQYLQLYKDPDNETNRQRMWELFHVSIHEYIHTLAHADYNKWANGLGGSEEHTLIEGFCDFFTLNVRAKFPESTLKPFQEQVEGSFYDAANPQAIPKAESLVGVYGSNEEAERMVGIIGIKNAQLGYFKGNVDLMGE